MAETWSAEQAREYFRTGQRSVERKKGAQKTASREKLATEHDEQKALIEFCKQMEGKYPELALLYAIPNGGQRHAAVAAKLKAEGVKAGVPDLFLPVARGNAHGLYIEMKRVGGQVSDAQRKMLAALGEQGYVCLVCYGWENAWREIEAYLNSKDLLVLGGGLV